MTMVEDLLIKYDYSPFHAYIWSLFDYFLIFVEYGIFGAFILIALHVIKTFVRSLVTMYTR